ncbi:MAG: ATP-binding protein [Puniceicoccales bacterium]|nr:ATP-binding protein [Puniceicoccales bacterium]
MQLLIFIGMPAAGKSSFWRERFSDTHLRINLDMLKTRHREKLLFEACLASKTPLAIDNTNLTRAERARYIAPARAAKFAVHGYFFESSYEDARRRNENRPFAQRVPEVALKNALAHLEPPDVSEGFDTLTRVRLTAAGTFETEA